MTYLGALILALAMGVALYGLFVGARDGAINYFGRRIARADNPLVFWFVMAVLIACLLLGARTMPIYFLALT